MVLNEENAFKSVQIDMNFKQTMRYNRSRENTVVPEAWDVDYCVARLIEIRYILAEMKQVDRRIHLAIKTLGGRSR
jgi:hypothetical protein